MSMPIDIVILYEKALRELDVACALKVMLERKGLSVAIVQQNVEYGHALSAFRPRLVVLPFCYQNRSNNIFLMRWRKAIFVNLTWEQFFYRGNSKAKTPRGDFPLSHVVHYAWSRDYVELLKGIGVPKDRIFLSGNPTLGLYLPPYKDYFKTRRELAKAYGLDLNRRWIFFPENYNWAFYEESMLRQMVADGQSVEDVSEMREFATRSFGISMDWCMRLVEDTEVELILRPRPATVPAVMRARTEERVGPLPPRFHILQDETVREWILASDLVISSYSTSMIEAALAGRAILMLTPLPIPESLAQIWHPLTPRASDYTELCLAAFAPDAASGAELAAWASENLLGDSSDPLQAIAHHLNRLCRGEVPAPPVASLASVTWGCPRGLPLSVWSLWKYLRTFLSQYKALLGVGATPVDELAADVAAKHTIADRCANWDDCLTQ
jgi:surface carbohydrate biosynthesis protein